MEVVLKQLAATILSLKTNCQFISSSGYQLCQHQALNVKKCSYNLQNELTFLCCLYFFSLCSQVASSICSASIIIRRVNKLVFLQLES